MKSLIQLDGGLENRIHKMMILMYHHYRRLELDGEYGKNKRYEEAYIRALGNLHVVQMLEREEVYKMKNSQFDKSVSHKLGLIHLGNFKYTFDGYIKQSTEHIKDTEKREPRTYYIAHDTQFGECGMTEGISDWYCDDLGIDKLLTDDKLREKCEVVCYAMDLISRLYKWGVFDIADKIKEYHLVNRILDNIESDTKDNLDVQIIRLIQELEIE